MIGVWCPRCHTAPSNQCPLVLPPSTNPQPVAGAVPPQQAECGCHRQRCGAAARPRHWPAAGAPCRGAGGKEIHGQPGTTAQLSSHTPSSSSQAHSCRRTPLGRALAMVQCRSCRWHPTKRRRWWACCGRRSREPTCERSQPNGDSLCKEDPWLCSGGADTHRTVEDPLATARQCLAALRDSQSLWICRSAGGRVGTRLTGAAQAAQATGC